MTKEDPTTQELRIEQLKRELALREAAEDEATGEHEVAQNVRRADKAEYLRHKLEQRAESERDDDEHDDR
jgi:hypothetical protein